MNRASHICANQIQIINPSIRWLTVIKFETKECDECGVPNDVDTTIDSVQIFGTFICNETTQFHINRQWDGKGISIWQKDQTVSKYHHYVIACYAIGEFISNRKIN